MGNLAKLPMAANDAPAEAQADEMLPAFEIAIAANFADLQQVHIRCPLKEPISRADANRIMDLMVDMGQRQVSRQEIRVNEAALRDKRKALALQERRKTEEIDKHEKTLADVEAEIVRITTKREALDVAGAAEHQSSGRLGDYKPQGHRKNQLAALDRDVAAQQDKVKTLEAEYQQRVLKTQDDLIERLTEEIAAIERVIAMHRERVG